MKLYRITPLVCALALVSAPVCAEGDAAAGRQKTWTCEGCHGIPDYRTAYPEVFTVPKLGGQSAGYIVKALQDYKAGTRYPLVVQLHGGPEDSDKFGPGTIFLTYQPALAAQGWAILRPNYRGSSGYGNASYRDPVGGYFKNSHKDVLAGVDRVIAMGIADPGRLAVTGESAGAHLVNKLITFTTRFKAASSYSGVANWISLYGQSDTRGDRDLWLGGTLWQKNAPIETYWEQSPLKYITQARTPTLFFIGENDPRVPMAQSVEMVRALKAQGVPSELNSYPDEGHTIQKPSHQLDKMNTELEWFNKYVRELPYAWEAVPAENDLKVVPAP
jgi:dipeptidyl aminopeptidase/acylaminoacyl peptidase